MHGKDAIVEEVLDWRTGSTISACKHRSLRAAGTPQSYDDPIPSGSDKWRNAYRNAATANPLPKRQTP